MTGQAFPGAAACVSYRDAGGREQVVVACAGTLAKGEPAVQPQTRYDLGRITECFVSVAALRMAARGALDTHRATIDVMHGIGAEDQQLVRLFVRQIAIDALIGGVAGAALAGLIIALILGGASTVTLLAGSPPLGWDDAFLLALLPFAIAALATLVARVALLRALHERL